MEQVGEIFKPFYFRRIFKCNVIVKTQAGRLETLRRQKGLYSAWGRADNAIKLRAPSHLAPSKSPPVGETLASIRMIFLSPPPYQGG